MKKLAFVTPWYGENISGGAEAALRGLVHHLQDAGVALEVLTTCVKDFRSDWSKNAHPAGLTDCAGIPVRRFPVRRRDTAAFDGVNAKLMRNQPVGDAEAETFLKEMINSPDLYRYICAHRADYALFIFTPYMFGTTYYGMQACPGQAVLIPCLHDEAYARLSPFRREFPKAAGMIFLSDPERDFARELYGVSGPACQSLGTGVDTGFTGEAERFREKYGIRSPFILYAGRKEAGKKVDVLLRCFALYKRRHPSDLKLVLLGGGKMELPCADILDLGFVSPQDKYDAYAAASVFCNPSRFESFSIVIMESWLSGVPVLVNGDCAVTKNFVCRAQAGLYYTTYAEFEGSLQYLFTRPEVAAQMGKNGRAFVRRNFAWDVIVDKYTRYFQSIGDSGNDEG